MNEPIPLPAAAKPRFRPHVKLSFDRRRERWVVLAPERMLVLDEIALEVLKRCTGDATLEDIIDGLAQSFDAPRAEIAADVTGLLADLREKGVLVL
jgi:pyrroloquinoline quinone biosynthesis protein D